jgi:hypothetical protein
MYQKMFMYDFSAEETAYGEEETREDEQMLRATERSASQQRVATGFRKVLIFDNFYDVFCYIV